MGLLVTLLGFAVSFVVRPLDGMVLGPLGDKIGRRKMLFFAMAFMALMAVATTAIGLLPTAGQVGLWVIIPLYLLKMLQGFSTGGEYSGAATYIAEFSPDRNRGFMTALLNSGAMLRFSAVALVAVLKMRESAARPLLGSVPVVTSREEAAALVAGQGTDERLDTATMLLGPVPATAGDAAIR